MSVPHRVRDEALASFRARRLGVGVADLQRDSLLDDELTPDGVRDTPDRRLLFSDGDLEIDVDVRYDEGRVVLKVRVEPGLPSEIEVLHLQDAPSLVFRGSTPMTAVSTCRGPASLAVSQHRADGSVHLCQTAWLVL